MRVPLAGFLLLVMSAITLAQSQPADTPQQKSDTPTTRQSICLLIESAALANGLPLEFFARVIWQESRFQPDATGPVTRSGERARGIAQFMPGTAAERGLLNPYDPVQALPKSAEFLSELRARFGNLGLAAAAYNAGPHRVTNFLSGQGGMPAETRNYVQAITGVSVEDWAVPGAVDRPRPHAPDCNTLMALLNREPNPFVVELQKRIATVAAAPWGVQLSADFSRDRALRNYAAIAKRHDSILQGRDPSILAIRLLSRGTRTFYQVRVGADTRAAAEQLCGTIRRAKGACLVLRNRA